MNKNDFVLELTERLSFLPQEDVEERLTFYSEMIDDGMEEGLTEKEAVAAVGSIETIVAQVVADIPLSKIAKEKMITKKQLKAWEIVLLVLGAPIWLSLGIAAFAVILSLYVSAWSVIISLWSVFVSLAACSIGSVLTCAILAIGGNGLTGVAMLAAGSVCVGLSIFMFYGCKAATTGILILTKKIAIWIKNCIIKKEEA